MKRRQIISRDVFLLDEPVAWRIVEWRPFEAAEILRAPKRTMVRNPAFSIGQPAAAAAVPARLPQADPAATFAQEWITGRRPYPLRPAPIEGQRRVAIVFRRARLDSTRMAAVAWKAPQPGA